MKDQYKENGKSIHLQYEEQKKQSKLSEINTYLKKENNNYEYNEYKKVESKRQLIYEEKNAFNFSRFNNSETY